MRRADKRCKIRWDDTPAVNDEWVTAKVSRRILRSRSDTARQKYRRAEEGVHC
jgi:hypothetical protein